MEKIDFDTIPARVLNYSSRILLGKFLNPEKKILSSDNYARDYRGLAEQIQFGFDDIKNFQRREDPTMKILEEWTVQPDATIGKLIKFLENMERHDVIQDLKPRFENDAKIYLQQIERYRECALQVPEEPTYYDAYIAYADEDIQFVYNLVQYLESNGFKLFVRSRDLLAGHSEYKTNVQLIQERCNRVLIVLSPNFIKSPACEVQATFAVSVGCDENRRKIVPILVEPCNDIPWLLRFRAIIDFTKPGIQDWMWDILKYSLRDVSSSSGLISSRKWQVQRRTELTQSSLPHSNNPVITFPSTASYSLKTDTSSNSGTSSTTKLVLDENSSDKIATNLEISAKPKQKNKLHNRFGQNRRFVGKGDIAFSSASISFSNAASGFHRQRSRGLESTDISNDYAQDTPL